MRVINQTTETAPIDALRPHPRNPRQGDIGAIHTSITVNGFYGTVIAQRSTGFILAGNHRWQAARKDNATEIPVTWVDVDDDHALRILLADNRTNDLATYNDEALAELLKDLHASTGTLLGTGYDGDDLDELLANLNPSFEPVPEDEQPRLDEKAKVTCPECGHEFAP
jgi:ParB-like chromosome segregation protein Spo0J